MHIVYCHLGIGRKFCIAVIECLVNMLVSCSRGAIMSSAVCAAALAQLAALARRRTAGFKFQVSRQRRRYDHAIISS